tara:strand:+ start:1353 stop:1475 length:123 start_codon:yes stop_codon:yes gene_type:complete
MAEEEINKDCPCTWDCPRHGKCTLCQEYHRSCGDKTSCGK